MKRVFVVITILFSFQASQAAYKDWQEWFEGQAQFNFEACEKVVADFNEVYRKTHQDYRSKELQPYREALYKCTLAASQALFQKFIRFGDTSPLRSQGPAGQIAVLPMSKIQDIYNELRKNPYFPYEIIETSGCFNRASYISLYLFSRGLTAGQVIAHGNFIVDGILDPTHEVGWDTHTAPFVFNEKKERVVLDPSLSAVPLTVKEWTNKMTEKSGDKKFTLSFDTSYIIQYHVLPPLKKRPQASFDDVNAFTQATGGMTRDLFHLLNNARPQRERHTPELLPSLVEFVAHYYRRTPYLEGKPNQ